MLHDELDDSVHNLPGTFGDVPYPGFSDKATDSAVQLRSIVQYTAACRGQFLGIDH